MSLLHNDYEPNNQGLILCFQVASYATYAHAITLHGEDLDRFVKLMEAQAHQFR